MDNPANPQPITPPSPSAAPIPVAPVPTPPVPTAEPTPVPPAPVPPTQKPTPNVSAPPPPPQPTESIPTAPPPPNGTFIVPTSPESSKKKYLIIGGVILLILLIVAGIWFLKPKPPSPNGQGGTNQNTGQKTPPQRNFHQDTLSNFTKEELNRLGIVNLPEGFQVQEEYKGIKFVKSPKKSFSDNQLALLHYFLDMTPTKLLSPGPTAVVTFETGEVQAGFTTGLTAVAYASGPYMFFNEESFSGGTLGVLIGDTSVDQAFTSFEHELTHVSQFNTASNIIEEKLANTPAEEKAPWDEAALSSSLFDEFAQKAGWTKTTEEGKVKFELTNKDSEKTTDYGKTSIVEDMAETVSGIISTKDYDYSDGRKEWALKYLNEDYEKLKPGKFPFSAKFTPVKSFFPDYDLSKNDEYKAKYKLTAEQIFTYETANSLEEIKNYLQTELNNRGWTGTFTKETKENGVEIYKADFTGEKRDIYVELRSYDNATGYETKPVGTVINVLSGYKL